MRSLSRSILRLCQRSSFSKIGSAMSSLRWLPALAPRDARLIASTSAHPLHPFSRHACTPWSLESKMHTFVPFTCGTSKCIATAKMRNKATTTKCTDTAMRRKIVTSSNPMVVDDVWVPFILPNSSHRDGAIYKNVILKEDWFDIDFMNRNETRLEPMMLCKPTEACLLYAENCMHFPQHMLQFFSLTLAECFSNNGPIQLYGYIAARDERDRMLNYVLNHSRDDPITVQQGSLIQMTGPKRGIEMYSPVFIEFDLRVKNGGKEEDDLQLIDGAIACYDQKPWRPIKHRINGKCGTVDISLAYVEHAVEATIEVVVSEVHSGFSLSLSSLVYIVENYEEIPLFHGTIDQSRGLRRFVVAVTSGTVMKLKFRFGSNSVERCCSFKAKLHGCVRRQIKHELASITVKVYWSTI
ncbi:hypothetical protein CFC21_089006 [Triticum aestivum]|uniref:DUF6598 domain-containing protein n=2 Tax=Triticum aestivum TaxID=4565 RepID=A0A3B6PMZ2_WHEAT|nr:uncharacterized protein LOC123138032 isoform X1 [Triticum aestivum]KAF7085598.1 hypothetical protein CFC21_089006 [Triticum aestivum]